MERRGFGLYASKMLVSLIALLCAPTFAAGDASGRGAAEASPGKAQRLQADSAGVDAWLRLGHERLRAGDLKEAEKVFRKALSGAGREKAAQAYNGLGLVYGARSHTFQTAIYYFQKALSKDPNCVEAHYNKAQVYFSHNWLSQATQAVERAVGIDSTYSPARQLLEKCLERKALNETQSKEAYRAYMKLNSKDLSGWMEWGKRILAEGDYEEMRRRLPPLVTAHPEWRDLLPFLAQAYWKANLIQSAWTAFRVYLEGQSEEEQALYEDIRLVSSQDLAEAYARSPKDRRKDLARRFWTERDPDFSTPVNERLMEHYRRVWYARTYFSKRKYPWDRRGEVYVRYGEPDHRSRSGAPSPPMSASVNAVKERYYSTIYDDTWTLFAMDGGKESLAFDREANPGTATGVKWFDAVMGGKTGSLIGPVFPVRSYDPDAPGGIYMPIGSTDFSIVPWESWVYADVDGGIVIDFTDEVGRGAFDYAPIPELGKTPGLRHQTSAGTDAIRALAGLTRRTPLVVMRTAVTAMPERYAIPPEDRPLDFYFDQAGFRGGEGASRLEVYYGIPASAASYDPDRGQTGLKATCRFALAEKGGGTVHRSETELVYLVEGDRTEGGGFIPHTARLDVPAGDYILDVRVENRASGEVGAYRKRLRVEAYPAGPLKLSDVQLAWNISEGETEDKFSKHGLRVLPMPIRLYKKGQSVFVYYEVYNLKRDASGRASYTVDYTVRSADAAGGIARMFRARSKDPSVSVAQEQVSTRETEIRYTELDLSESPPGKVVLRITVNDLIGNQTAWQEVSFRVEE